MDTLNIFALIPKYDIDKGGKVFTNYIQLYQDFINEVISSNESLYSIFDCRTCDEIYLPYLSAFLGYVWNYEDDVEKQRYELFSLIEKRKRIGTMWFFEDMFNILGITVEVRNLIYHVLTLSGPEVLSGDFYIEGLEKYHEGSIEMIVDGPEIEGLTNLMFSAIPAGMHLHVTFTG